MRRLRTVLVGAGRMGAGYAADPVMARYFPFATHAQVLAAHPRYSWDAIVDPSLEARTATAERWGVSTVAARVEDLAPDLEPEVAILATPPALRMAILDAMPSVRAVLVEKPLGRTVREAADFIEHCKARDILVQVNVLRRADQSLRALADGRMRSAIGEVQAAFATYGNGLLNNGTHLVDLVRMLLGEIRWVQALAESHDQQAGPIEGDRQVSFAIGLHNGSLVTVQSLCFRQYREVGIDVSGETGRMTILNEGLTLATFRRAPNRAMQGERELVNDEPEFTPPTIGDAMYGMYDNLAAAVLDHADLWSPGDCALETATVVDAVLSSADADGARIAIAAVPGHAIP